jgi:outer membrane receptor protein involved in Fe transport
MKYFICILLLPLFSNGWSQQVTGACKIKGKITDSITHQPVSYAAVTIYLRGATNISGGSITGDNGAFTIDHLPTGEYQLKVESISYTTKYVYNISLSDKHAVTDVGTISVTSNTNNMKEVTVNGTKKFMETRLDKFVFNVDNDITTQGGVATDILKKVPQVTVDVDGNVSLLGNANIRVFINGKASTMFDNNLAEALQSIPASQIKSIEVISTPGAQYDAQGTGGIINIILKDNTSRGINGSITLSGGTLLQNGSANIHAKTGAVDLSASVSGNAQVPASTMTSLNNRNDSGQQLQNGRGTLQKNGYRAQLGASWAISKTDNLSASASYNNFGTITNATTNQTDMPLIQNSADTSTLRYSDNHFRYSTLDWNLSYVKKFSREGQELDLSVQSGYGRGNTHYSQSEDYLTAGLPVTGAEGNNKLKDNETYLIADYAQPLGKNIILNTGLKTSLSDINSYSDHYLLDPTSDNYIFDTSQLNNFGYRRGVYAAYASLTFPLSTSYTMKLGARDEYTKITTAVDTAGDPSYNSFIPSIIIAHKINEHQTIKISYSRRIQRAGYRELNPFIDATDPTNLTQGNPYLKPERSNVGELTYTSLFDKGSALLVTLFYRNTEDDEQSYVVHDSMLTVGTTTYRNVNITTNENAGHQQLTGLNISGNVVCSQKLDVRCNAMIFDKYIQSNFIPGNTINSINYRINVNATYQFNKTLVAEFFGNFNSPRTEIQGTFPSFTSYSFAVRQMLFHKKASIAFTTTDPFNKYVDQATNVTGPNFTLYSDRQIPYRSFGMSFSYKFGKMEFKERKQEHVDTGEENN